MQCLQKNTWAEVLKACNFIKKRLVAASGSISWTFSLLNDVINLISWYVLASQCLFHFTACVLLLSISFLFSDFFCGFHYFLVLRQVCCQYSGVVPRFLSEVLRRALLQPYLVINLPGLVQFRKNLSYILPALVSQNCLQQSVSMTYFLYLAEVLQQPSYHKKRTGNWKMEMMKFFALTLYLLARITLTLISSSAITGCFQKLDFQEFNLVIWNF